MRTLLRSLLALISFALPALALAAPTIATFQTGSTNLNPEQIASVSWTVQDAGGYSYVFSCITGVTFRDASAGTPIPCGTPVTTLSGAPGGVDAVVVNVSGVTRSFALTVTPKDTLGNDVPSAARVATFSVTTVPDPILSFSSSADSTIPGVPVTFSWTTHEVGGVNLQVACDQYVSALLPGSLPVNTLPCATMLSPVDLPTPGTFPLVFTNPTLFPRPFTLTLIPAMAPGVYDATHAQTTTIMVLPTPVAPTPVVTSFTASKTIAYDHDPVDLSWQTTNTTGANMMVTCPDGVSAFSVSGTNMTLIPCNQNISPTDLLPAGTTTLAFVNRGAADQNVVLTLTLATAPGSYTTAGAKAISITVKQGSAPASAVPAPQPSLNISTQQTGTNASGFKYHFIKALKRGSKGADVTALQTFLAQDPALYPEGSVTGYFGPATERAVQRFQKKYNLISSGTPSTTGYGAVGPKTRAQLNALTQ